MTPIRRKIHAATGVFLGLIVTGCASAPPPLAELDQAEAEVDRARTAGAAASAPVELRFAQDKLLQARTANDKRDFKVATQLAAQAMVDAELAAAKSRAAKARAAVRAKVDDNARLRSELLSEGNAP
jgi:hypothetical protein